MALITGIVRPLFVLPGVLFWYAFVRAGPPRTVSLAALRPGLGAPPLLGELAFADWCALQKNQP